MAREMESASQSSMEGQDVVISIDVRIPKRSPEMPLLPNQEVPIGIIYPESDNQGVVPAFEYPDHPLDPDEIERRIAFYDTGIKMTSTQG